MCLECCGEGGEGGFGGFEGGGRPRSRMVWEVTGPMLARTVAGGICRPAASRRAARFWAVLAEVKVMASGGAVRKRVWRASMESWGMTVR